MKMMKKKTFLADNRINGKYNGLNSFAMHLTVHFKYINNWKHSLLCWDISLFKCDISVLTNSKPLQAIHLVSNYFVRWPSGAEHNTITQ